MLCTLQEKGFPYTCRDGPPQLICVVSAAATYATSISVEALVVLTAQELKWEVQAEESLQFSAALRAGMRQLVALRVRIVHDIGILLPAFHFARRS